MGNPSPLQLANFGLVNSPLSAGLRSPPQIDPSVQDLAIVQGTDDVAQCIQTIILTHKGEIIGNEDFGTTVPDMLFEPVQGFLDAAPREIQMAVQTYEPRVSSLRVQAEQKQGQTGPYVQITVYWKYKRVLGTVKNGSITLSKYIDTTGGQTSGWKLS